MTQHTPESTVSTTQPQWLSGQLLIAMPSMEDQHFSHSVILICTHNADGAMGLVINKLYGALNFSALLEQLDITLRSDMFDINVHYGGPVETGRGFVLHSGEYKGDNTSLIMPDVALTATVDILKDMATGSGPRHALLALGYAAWSAGQLETELQHNGWLVVPPDTALLFDAGLETKWDRAIAKLGIDPALFTGASGNA